MLGDQPVPIRRRERRTSSASVAAGWARSCSRAAARRRGRAPPPAAGARLAARSRDRPRAARREAFEAEALRRADAIKTALLRAVSHDLRTPLMAISTSAGALARPDLDDRRRRPRRAARDDPRRVRPARPARRQSARPLAPPGGRRPARPASSGDVEELVVQALDELGEDGSRVEVTFPDELSGGARRCASDPARARQPDRERAQVLAGRRAGAHAGCGDAVRGGRSA